MRKRHNGFTSFMKKQDGVTEDDHIFAAEGIGRELYQRHECLLELLRAEYDWSTYVQRVVCLSGEERYACRDLRLYLGLLIPFDKVGVYVDDRTFYRKAIEYLREYQAREQQTRVSSGVDESNYIGYSPDYYIIDDYVPLGR